METRFTCTCHVFRLSDWLRADKDSPAFPSANRHPSASYPLCFVTVEKTLSIHISSVPVHVK